MTEDELPEGFMNHLHFSPDPVPEDEVLPQLTPGYPLVFTPAVPPGRSQPPQDPPSA